MSSRGQLIAGIGALGLVVGTYYVLAQKSNNDTEPLEHVIIAEGSQPIGATIYVAYAKGYFAREGLEVTLQPHTSGRDALNAVLQGTADLATTAETPIMHATLSGHELYAIATIATTDKDMAIVARNDNGVVLPADLKGKKIGASAATNGEFFLSTFLVVNGLSMNDIEFVDVQPEEMVDALVNGEVDAVSTWQPHLGRAQEELGAKGTTFDGSGLYTFTWNVAATQDFVHGNRTTVEKILQALNTAAEFMSAEERESQRIVADHLSLDEAQLNRQWALFDFDLTLTQSLLMSLENQAQWIIRRGNEDEVIVPDFVDVLYLEGLEAVKPEAITVIR